jgi:hypothetical protein
MWIRLEWIRQIVEELHRRAAGIDRERFETAGVERGVGALALNANVIVIERGE